MGTLRRISSHYLSCTRFFHENQSRNPSMCAQNRPLSPSHRQRVKRVPLRVQPDVRVVREHLA